MMKEKILKFVKEKRELLVFLGVMVILFTAVITIAEVTLKSSDKEVSNVEEVPPAETETPKETEPSPSEPKAPETMKSPVNGEYVVVREFFDLNNESALTNSIIVNGTTLTMSKGVGFAKSDDKEFSCINTISGTVLSVVNTDLNGYVITVDNSDGLITKYYNLSSVNVKENDKIMAGKILGQSGNSLTDTEAGNHIYIEMKLNNTYLNPVSLIGKTINEIKSMEK